MRITPAVSILLFTIVCASEAAAQTCERLTSLSAGTTTVTLAQVVAPGAFTPPGRGGRAGGANPYAALPSLHVGWAVLLAIGVAWSGGLGFRWTR